MRLIRLKTVVLPAPLGPISVNASPWRTSKLTLLTASTPPKRTLRSRADSRLFRLESFISPCSLQAFGLGIGLLPLEHALAVERKQLQPGAHLQPAAIQPHRLEQHEGHQHHAVDHRQ